MELNNFPTPSLSAKIKDLDPELCSLIEILISENESKSSVLSKKIKILEDKLENFRGMISRRDDKICKLESKLKIRN